MEKIFICPDGFNLVDNKYTEVLSTKIEDALFFDMKKSRYFKKRVDMFFSGKLVNAGHWTLANYSTICHNYYMDAILTLISCNKFMYSDTGNLDMFLAGFWVAMHGNRDAYIIHDEILRDGDGNPIKIDYSFHPARLYQPENAVVEILVPGKKSKKDGGRIYYMKRTINRKCDAVLADTVNKEYSAINDPKGKKIKKTDSGEPSIIYKKWRNKLCVKVSASHDYFTVGYLAALFGYKNIVIEKVGPYTAGVDEVFRHIKTLNNSSNVRILQNV